MISDWKRLGKTLTHFWIYLFQDSSLNVSKMGTTAHAFDLEAEVEPIPDLGDEDDDGGGGGGPGEFGMDADDFNPDTIDNNDAGQSVTGRYHGEFVTCAT